jgi:hypothetical protein
MASRLYKMLILPSAAAENKKKHFGGETSCAEEHGE